MNYKVFIDLVLRGLLLATIIARYNRIRIMRMRHRE